MKDAQLEKLSAKELMQLISRAESVIDTKKAAERNEVRQKVEDIARQAGFSVSELFGRGAGRKGQKVAPKYRNPKNPNETWTGRGRKPRWMTQAGGDPKRFLID